MTCDFKYHRAELDCSGSIKLVESLQRDISDNVLSENGMLYSNVTKGLSVCDAHLNKSLLNIRSKYKAVRCAIPTFLSNHSKHGKVLPKAERHLSIETILKINKNTGIVFSIGTAICSNCRKHLITSDEQPDMCSSPQAHDVAPVQNVVTRKLEIPVDDEQPSQDGSALFTESQESQESQDSECMPGKLAVLNSFLQLSKISPVKEKHICLKESCEKTQKRCVAKAMQCMSAVCNVICPGEGNLLKEIMFQSVTSINEQPLNKLDKTAIIMTEIYNCADTWTLRRQILSVLSRNYTLDEVQEMIPGLTSYRYYSAKRHAEDVGIGEPVTVEKVPRCKINENQLEHFIDYITSSHIVKDLPFGTKTMKLSSGEIVNVPNLIRSLAPASLVNQYVEFCASESFKPLGTSTLYKILNDCSASVRKCVEGLDYFVAEGGQAFIELERIVDELDISDIKKKSLRSSLLDGKRYIKSDLKVHIQRQSTIPDHCRLFSLSDDDKSFSGKCDHKHDSCCTSCSNLHDVLQEIVLESEKSSWDNKDAILFQVEHSVNAINEWKAHIMRSINQEKARLDLLRNFHDNQVFITADWAMKFLPRKFREGQTDWFGKRGVNWHIAVSLHKEKGVIKSTTHVHLFSSQVSQDSSITSAILCNVVADLTKMIPTLCDVHFFSDNAGCYKNTSLMLALKLDIGEKLKSYNFSEAQDGKGPCDRMAAHMKGYIKRYINEGHDVTTAAEMKQAIDCKQNGSFRVKVVDVLTNVDAEKSKIKAIPGISQLHNFSFFEDGLRVWRAYDIGPGKLIKWENIESLAEKCELVVQKDCIDTISVSVETDDDDVDENPPSKRPRQVSSDVFDCPKDGCVRSFKSQTALDQHIIIGNCDYKLEKSIHNKAKIMYGQKVNSVFTKTSIELPCADLEENKTSESIKGWALRTKKKKSVCNEKQVNFMKDNFEVGKATGRKVDPFKAANDMRQLKENNKFVFKRSEYLTGQQIAAYFSRLAMKDRKSNLDDYSSAEVEDSKKSLKQEIINKLNISQ